MPKLEQWSVVSSNPYLPPEFSGKLSGIVYGHPLQPDGKQVTTSRIKSACGRLVTTRSGTTYELGAAAPEYREWVRASLGKEIDEVNPVTVKEVE